MTRFEPIDAESLVKKALEKTQAGTKGIVTQARLVAPFPAPRPQPVAVPNNAGKNGAKALKLRQMFGMATTR